MKSRWVSRRLIASIIVFGLPLAIYLTLLNQNYGWDATMFILRIEDGSLGSLFHPHHLLYNPLGYILSKFLESIGLTPSTALIMQVLNSVFGALGVLIFFRILLKLSDRVELSAIFALLLAFSMAYWEYTIEVEVYIIPTVFLLIGLLLMVAYLSSGQEKPRHDLFLKLGLLTSVACLFHQMHILFCIVVIAFLVLTVKSGRQRIKMLGIYLAPFVVLVCGGYIVVAQVTGNLTSLGSFWNWVTYTFHVGAGWGTFDYDNFPSAAYGLFKTFFARSEIRDYLISGAINRSGIGILVVMSIAGILLVSLAITTIFNFKRIYRSYRSLTIVLVIWLLAYGIFCLWFDPYTHEFWIPLLPPIWLLIFLAIQRWKSIEGRLNLWPKIIKVIPIVLLLLLASVNLVGDILPNSDISNNENYQLAGKLKSIGAGEGDVVRIWGPVPLNNYYRLFFGSEMEVSSLANRPSENSDVATEAITKDEWLAYHEHLIEDTLSTGGRVFLSENELTPNSRESTAFLGEQSLIKIADYPVFYAKYSDNLIPLFSYKWRSEEIQMFEIKDR